MTGKIVKIFNYLEEYVLACFVLALAVLTVIQIITRYSAGFGFFWLEETGRHVLIFITFLGASLGVKYGSHFSMTALERSLPAAASHMVRALVNLGCAIFFIVIVYYGLSHVMQLQRFGVTTSTLRIPLYIPYLAIPVFSTVIALRFFLIFLKEGRAFLARNRQGMEERV